MLKQRSPVVTFLGHVDHGKTSLLDAIRATHVTEKEDGGITQHIGSYHLKHKTAGEVTFLDTPGHAAFTAMRARGAQMTDVVVLVVAADDGVMPQTIEAINHAKAAGVPVVVALNKCDLGTQNFTKIYGQLAEHGLTPSGDWGGETDVLATSAVTGEGIDALVEHLAALGEVLDLKADYKGDATGVVIEAETKEGVGAVVRVLVQQGMLKTGSVLVCGNAFGKVRALIDDRGKRIKQAGPSIPVEVWGLDEVPAAGDHFYQVKNMQVAKSVAEDVRRQRASESRAETRRLRSLEDVFKRRELGELPELNVIVKADVDGSLDALRNMLEQFPSDEVRLTIRHAAVGPVTDSDVLLADTSDAIVIAFRVTPSTGAKRLADEKGVDVRQYKVIYEVGDEIRKAMEGLLEPEEKIENRATCEVRDVFKITKLGQVAGCFVTDGTVQRNHLVRLVRDGIVVREGSKIDSLRRFKDDVKEVRAGMECGIRIENFDDIKVGDVIESYEVVKLPRKLAVT
jgi:translation initiation factor IF-2